MTGEPDPPPAAAPEPAEPERIDSSFRSGSLTAIGIVVGFSLGFLTRWAGIPGGWSAIDFISLAVITAGISVQIVSLSMLLSIESLILARYNRMVRIFMIGLVLVAIGVLLAVFADIAGHGQKALSG